ncbi:hypothetical protein M2428_001083 [Arthrobacter sp. ES3-54]|jgi:hypothetical protein|nr:hypothetical protein [Arthrobacter sp. ES3-54]
MPKQREDGKENPAPTTGPAFPRMLTLEQVQEILNVKGALVYSLVPGHSKRLAGRKG